jgi:hypothetical protein
LTIPIILFAYARPQHLANTLDCLKRNKVPLIYAFSDGPKETDIAKEVAQVRTILQAVNWCDIIIDEKQGNSGLGTSIRGGVSQVLARHDSAIVFEDDLVCVEGTYDYMCSALRHYADNPEVMSVTGWTHPRVTPAEVVDQPYFDGRAECWVWGTWARAWSGMDLPALSLVEQCRKAGIDVNKYGYDLLGQAKGEIITNIWAVRFLYLHILKRGLCLRPPWSMVEHVGIGQGASNVLAESQAQWQNPPLRSCPPIPTNWPDPIEHIECSVLWQKANPKKSLVDRFLSKVNREAKKFLDGSKHRSGSLCS